MHKQSHHELRSKLWCNRFDTNEPFCLNFSITVQSCQLNSVHVLPAPSNISVLMMKGNEIALRINDWNSVNLQNDD